MKKIVRQQVKMVHKGSVITFNTDGAVVVESRKGTSHTGTKARISKAEMRKHSTYRSNIKKFFSRDVAEISAALSTPLDADAISQKYAKYRT